MSDTGETWSLYIRWPSGKRERIITDRPVAPLQAWIMAAVRMPRLVWFPGYRAMRRVKSTGAKTGSSVGAK